MKFNKITKWMILIAWLVVIFVFSNQSGEVSSEHSRLVVYVFEFIGIDLNSMIGDLSTYIVRKSAHFLEYFILALLINNVLKEYCVNRYNRIIILMSVFVYACSDEFHQSFIPGRAARFKDVMIDTSGGFTALVLSYRVAHLKNDALQNKDLTKFK